MTIRILAIAAAMALGTAALAQGTAAPGASAPTPAVSGANPTGSAAVMPNGLNGSPDLNSNGATGAVQSTNPNGVPATSGPAKSALPPYIVPAHPAAPSGDDGSTAGKSNAD
jgi:hypothetical protein